MTGIEPEAVYNLPVLPPEKERRQVMKSDHARAPPIQKRAVDQNLALLALLAGVVLLPACGSMLSRNSPEDVSRKVHCALEGTGRE